MSRNPQFYLGDVIEAGRAIGDYVQGYSKDQFLNDPKTVDAVVRRLEIIGEAVKQFPDSWKEAEPQIPWTAIAGFRNILAHAYFKIEEDIIWETIQEDLPDLLAACERIQKRR
ncbi:MAG: DUF86 domain-containing protein [Oceanipulchritudo sp.]